MKILAVDDEQIALKSLEIKLGQCSDSLDLTMFISPIKALQWVQTNHPDIAFLDINMRGLNGLELAVGIKKACPNCAIVFVTGYTEYAIDAFKIKANGYLVKPIDVEDLKKELEYAQKQIPLSAVPSSSHRIYVQCFGNFEVFMDNKPIIFHRKKAKEVFAYLIDRKGASVSLAEIASVLWEDGMFGLSRANQIHTFLSDLVKTFKDLGEPNMIIKSRNAISVNVSLLDCDFYDCVGKNPATINQYTGEYMSQYSWAELTGGKLASMMDSTQKQNG